MKGHLHLTAALNDMGGTCLRDLSFSAPLHVSKPHEDAGALVVNIVNPTAGLFDGDEIECSVNVGNGAHLVLTTPSANRVYRARSDRSAMVNQRFHVAAGGFMEFYPELLIPQAGARYQQNTELRVENGGNLLFFEWLAPGRVASGEAFQFEELFWNTDICYDQRLVARERYTLHPATESVEALQQVFPESHYLALFVIGDIAFPSSAVEALQNDDLYLGHTRMVAGGWSIKALCRDGLTTRRLMKQLRQILHEQFGERTPFLGHH